MNERKEEGKRESKAEKLNSAKVQKKKIILSTRT
jgi:hypothetical protein